MYRFYWANIVSTLEIDWYYIVGPQLSVRPRPKKFPDNWNPGNRDFIFLYLVHKNFPVLWVKNHDNQGIPLNYVWHCIFNFLNYWEFLGGCLKNSNSEMWNSPEEWYSIISEGIKSISLTSYFHLNSNISLLHMLVCKYIEEFLIIEELEFLF